MASALSHTCDAHCNMLARKCIVALLVALSLVALACAAAPPCRFAKSYSTSDLLTSGRRQAAYLRAVMYMEGQFHKVGYNNLTGITYDGTGLDYATGQPASPLHYWTAASKESIHLMMLAKALAGNSYARIFVHPNGHNPASTDKFILKLLETKMATLEAWVVEYPGFGGFLPWLANRDTGIEPMPDWRNQVPALDNGEMIWALFAVQVAASQRSDSRSILLGHRVREYLEMLAVTAPIIFYEGNGHIRAVATVKNNKAAPTNPNNYGMNCQMDCYLDDPYEGELFAVFLDLYSNISNREDIWVAKRAKLQSVTYDSVSGPITVQRGWWFSSHEQWKYLELPYLTASDINKRVFLNGERARTLHSASMAIPGLYASVTDVCPPGQLPPTYISAAGIQSIAFQPVLRRDVVTPYGAFPTILADMGVGLAWYNLMLNGSSMQGPLGSTEAIDVNATMISPVATWDSKITTVVAMVGGVADLVQAGMIRDGTYARFAEVINREWSKVFPTLQGENIPLALPTVTLPRTSMGDFVTCRA